MIFRLALRNIFRQKRRTGLTILITVTGGLLLIFFAGVSDGMHERMILDSTSAFTGLINIHQTGYYEQRSIYKRLEKKEHQRISNHLNKMKEIKAFSKRVFAQGLISKKGSMESEMAVITGIIPAAEKEVTSPLKVISDEDFKAFSENKNGIILGKDLAELMEVKKGDAIVFLTFTAQGREDGEIFTVHGTFSTMSSNVNKTTAFVHLSTLQKLIEVEDDIMEISVIPDDTDDIKQAVSLMKNEFKSLNLEILPWWEIVPELYLFVVMDDVSLYIFAVIIVFIIALGLMSTILMSVMERTREFGILKAIGTSPKRIFSLIIMETFIMIIISVVIGFSIGLIANDYFSVYGFDLGESFSIAGVNINPVIYTKTTVKGVILSFLEILIICISGALYPAFKASRITPVDALRFE